jgi:hypothetical protein
VCAITKTYTDTSVLQDNYLVYCLFLNHIMCTNRYVERCVSQSCSGGKEDFDAWQGSKVEKTYNTFTSVLGTMGTSKTKG